MSVSGESVSHCGRGESVVSSPHAAPLVRRCRNRVSMWRLCTFARSPRDRPHRPTPLGGPYRAISDRRRRRAQAVRPVDQESRIARGGCTRGGTKEVLGVCRFPSLHARPSKDNIMQNLKRFVFRDNASLSELVPSRTSCDGAGRMPLPLPTPAASADPRAAMNTPVSSGSSVFNPLTALEGNPYFSAGFGLAIMGTGLAVMRGAGKAAVTMAKRHLLITLEVTSKDRAYPWVLQWLTEQAQHTSLGQHMSVQTVVKKLANGKTTTSFEFLPSTGSHIVSYNGHLVMVDRVREQQTVDLQTGQPWECVAMSRPKAKARQTSARLAPNFRFVSARGCPRLPQANQPPVPVPVPHWPGRLTPGSCST